MTSNPLPAALISFALSASGAAEPARDPIDAAAGRMGLVQIEDDVGQRQFYLAGTETTDCVTVLRGKDGETLAIDWTKTRAAVMSEGFIWVQAPPAGLAIVGDVERREELEKMIVLSGEIGKRAKRCAGPAAMTDEDRPK